MNSSMRARAEIWEAMKKEAHKLGFDALAVAPVKPLPHREEFFCWLALGYQAQMDYIERTKEKRADPAKIMPEAKSILVAVVNYLPPEEQPPEEPYGRIARYAVGKDYHRVLREKWEHLAHWLKKDFPELEYRIYVDTGPILEREIAMLAGLGFIGKNTCLIHPKLGSWLFISEMLVNVEIPPDAPFVGHLCGTCTRCIDTCPTQAIIQPWVLDARKCISYWTIEHKGDFPEEVIETLDNWLFGCDICQEVCPWNRKAPLTKEASFQPIGMNAYLPLSSSEMPEEVYREKFRKSAIRRVKWRDWVRNLKAVKQNWNRATP